MQLQHTYSTRIFAINPTTYLDLQPFFEDGLAFLKEAFKTEKKLSNIIGGGWEKPSGIKGLGISLRSQSIKSFTNSDSLFQLRQLIELIIDPTEIDISMEKLIQDYGYPAPSNSEQFNF